MLNLFKIFYIKPFIFLIILVFLQVTFVLSEQKKDEKNKTAHFLTHFRFSHLFSFRSQSLCPESSNTYVIGARARLSGHLRQKLPVVTAFEVMCSDNLRNKLISSETLSIDKNIGEWTKVKECSNGLFATEITFHLETFETFALVAEADRFKIQEIDSTGRQITDVRSIIRSRYVAGISLRCNYNTDHDHFEVHKPQKILAPDIITVGTATGYGLQIFCLHHKVISGIYASDEALVGFTEERLVPIKLTIKCQPLYNPVQTCYPNLNWERISLEDINCGEQDNQIKWAISRKSTEIPSSFSCKVNHFVGATLNKNITNLQKILDAYAPINIDTMDGLLVQKLLSERFKRDWLTKYKLSRSDYIKIIKSNPFSYVTVANQTTQLKFSYKKQDDEIEKMVGKENGTEYDLSVMQLVGYCSIYKVYFPLFKNEFKEVVHKNLGGIDREIIFENLDKLLNK